MTQMEREMKNVSLRSRKESFGISQSGWGVRERVPGKMPHRQAQTEHTD